MDKDNIDETSRDIIDDTKDNTGNNGDHPKMKYCPNCGKLKPENYRYCPECGRDKDGFGAGSQPFIQYPKLPQPAYGAPYRQSMAAEPDKRIGFALAALIVSLANFFFFSSILTFLSLPAVIVLSVLTYKKKCGGRTMVMISLIITAISAVLFAFYVAIIVKIAPDIQYFAKNGTEIVENYDATGEIPERYEKYRKSEYKGVWNQMGYDDFDDFFEYLVDSYRKYNMKKDKPVQKAEPDYVIEDETGESTTQSSTDFDHSGEDLVVLS